MNASEHPKSDSRWNARRNAWGNVQVKAPSQILVDDILVKRFQQGDPTALDELLKKYHSRAFMYALKLTKQVDEADDILSEGYSRVHRAIGRYRADSSFTTWMFKILRNCFLDARKKRGIVSFSLDSNRGSEDEPLFLQPIDRSDSPHDCSVKAEHARELRAVIAQLPECYRCLLLLYYVEDLTYQEIADRLSTPTGTVKSRLSRAKGVLKSTIKCDPELAGLMPSA